MFNGQWTVQCITQGIHIMSVRQYDNVHEVHAS